jgi:hypothetical protein
MAGLAHGLAVITNTGPLTDAALRACEGLVFFGDDERAAARLRELVRSSEARRRWGEAAGAWYRAH